MGCALDDFIHQQQAMYVMFFFSCHDIFGVHLPIENIPRNPVLTTCS